MTYFNTTHETGRQLDVFRQSAVTQTDLVMDLMRQHKALSASQVYQRLIKQGHNVLLTSIRRSMSVLANDGHLVKSTEKIQGQYGRNEYIYQLQNTQPC